MLSKLVILALVIAVCKAQYFTAKNGKIYDAKGSEFLIRGINSAHADWDNYNRNYAYDSIPNIANTGANTLRVQWRRNLQGGLSRTNLENIIKRAIQYKMAVILQLHDATGSDNTNELYECAKWFKDNVDLLWTYKQYLIVNIANEWSPWGTSFEKWRDAYRQAISTIRSTGWNGLLLVDGSAYAQNPDCILF
jgi:mannan endo-1,4-beta-mannosidase